MSSHFGTFAELEAARAQRRLEIQAWAKQMHLDADIAAGKVVVFEQEPEETETVEPAKPASKASKRTATNE